MSRIAAALAEELEMPANEVNDVERGALLHDIGKMGHAAVDPAQAGATGRAEWAVMRIRRSAAI